jgi:DNA-binding IclR family transcriptional regulator
VKAATSAADPDPSTPSGSVIALLRGGPRQADELAATLRLPTGQVLALLGIMEIQGMVLQRPGLTYVLPAHALRAGIRHSERTRNLAPRVSNECHSERSEESCAESK